MKPPVVRTALVLVIVLGLMAGVAMLGWLGQGITRQEYLEASATARASIQRTERILEKLDDRVICVTMSAPGYLQVFRLDTEAWVTASRDLRGWLTGRLVGVPTDYLVSTGLCL